jgi:hypothetical protein
MGAKQDKMVHMLVINMLMLDKMVDNLMHRYLGAVQFVQPMEVLVDKQLLLIGVLILLTQQTVLEMVALVELLLLAVVIVAVKVESHFMDILQLMPQAGLQ